MSSKIDLTENVSADVPGTPSAGKLSVYAKDDGNLYAKNDAGTETNLTSGGGGGAPTDATYIVQTPDGTLTNEQALSALATGILKSTTITGVLSIATGADLPTVPVTNGGTGLTTLTSGALYTGNGTSNPTAVTGTTNDDIVAWDGSAFSATKPPIRLLASGTLGSASANIDLTSIPATYRDLKLVVYGRSAIVATVDDMRLRLNNDTTITNYNTAYTVNGAVNVDRIGTVASITHVFTPGASSDANAFAQIEVYISNYANTSNYKMAFSKNAGVNTISATNIYPLVCMGLWESTTAINRLTFFPNGGNWVTGTTYSLYGIG